MIIIRISGKETPIPEYVKLDMEFAAPEPPQEIQTPANIPEPEPQETKPVIPIERPEMAVEEEPPAEEEKEEADPRNSILFIPKTREDSLKLWADDLKDFFSESRAVPQGFDIYSFLEMDPKKLLDSLDKSFDENAKVREYFTQPLREMREFKGGVDGYKKTQEYLFKRQGGTKTAPINLLIMAAGQLAKKLIDIIFSKDDRPVLDRNMSEFEILIMNIIWDNGFAFPSMVYTNIRVKDKPIFSQFKDVMNSLELKGLLKSAKDNTVQERVYIPAITRQDILEYHLALLGEANRQIKESQDNGEYIPSQLYEKRNSLKQKARLLLNE
jgi:hypothetical protein